MLLRTTRYPEPVAMIDHTSDGDVEAGTPEVLHYLHDVLGSVVALTNAAGEVVERYDYDPYGKTYITDNTLTTYRGESKYGNPFMWTGQAFDQNTRQYHFWARTYSPHLGRWLHRDPLGYVDGVSLYEYVCSDPISSKDPFGLITIVINGFIFRESRVSGDHNNAGQKHYDVIDGNKKIGEIWEDGSVKKVRNPRKLSRARTAWLTSGMFAVGLLLDEAFGAASVLDDLRKSVVWEDFLQALENGDWRLVDQYRDWLFEHALLGNTHRSKVDVGVWLDNLIAKRRAQWEKEQEEKKKEENEKKEDNEEDDDGPLDPHIEEEVLPGRDGLPINVEIDIPEKPPAPKVEYPSLPNSDECES